MFVSPWWLSSKESACQYRRPRFNPWVERISWRRKWQPTPIFLPGKPHEQRSLVSYSPRGRRRVRHDLATKQQLHSLISQKPHTPTFTYWFPWTQIPPFLFQTILHTTVLIPERCFYNRIPYIKKLQQPPCI